jgi:hypothetical protein
MELESANEETGLAKRLRNIVIVLCLIGGIKIFVFSAAFPFFNNVDEKTHFDLVYKYSKGYLFHSGIEKFNTYSAEMIILYGSPEYLYPNLQTPEPYWRQPDFTKSSRFRELVEIVKDEPNYEAGSPPFYYFAAGLWYRAGAMLGLSDSVLLYWTRFFNIPVFMALIWLSWRLAAICFSDIYRQIALPLFITFFPQDVFYSINPDSLSPLLFALLSLILLKIYFDKKSWKVYLSAGLTAAALFLTRMPNISLYVLIFAIIIFEIKRIGKNIPVLHSIINLSSLLISFSIPVGLWLFRNYSQTDSITGMSDKIKFWGWTIKPLNQIWNHPFFMGNGVSHFFAELTKSFWRGELVWHLKPISSSAADFFYIASSAIFCTISLIFLISAYKKLSRSFRITALMSFMTVGASLFLLAFSSIIYDFHDSFAPSRESPFFVAGRTISSVIIPFAIIYIDGFWRLFAFLGRRWPLAILVLIMIAITVSEFWLTKDVFASQYNFFAFIAK